MDVEISLSQGINKEGSEQKWGTYSGSNEAVFWHIAPCSLLNVHRRFGKCIASIFTLEE
jgi:hypothetical protein